jgi:hypothetical protein
MAKAVSTRDTGAQTAKFQLSEGVRVFADDGRIIQPGQTKSARLASSGSVPIGYYRIRRSPPKRSA